VGYKESKRRYRKKQFKSDEILGELYRGAGGKPGEAFGSFKKRVKRLI